MMFTEEEVGKKWCPFARHAYFPEFNGTAAAAVNRPQATPVNCIGSACMAWRWQPSDTNQPPRGFCGLAGKLT
jgi:hypothetical protein